MDAKQIAATAAEYAGRHPQEIVALAIKEYGPNIAISFSGAEDVVLVDIGLPDIPGYEVGKRLRDDIAPDAWLIALTGYGRPVDRQRSQEAGFDAHLLKPIDVDRLISTLWELSTRRSGAPPAE